MNAEKRLTIAADEASRFFSLRRHYPRTLGPGHPSEGTEHHIADETAQAILLEWHKALNGYRQAITNGEL